MDDALPLDSKEKNVGRFRCFSMYLSRTRYTLMRSMRLTRSIDSEGSWVGGDVKSSLSSSHVRWVNARKDLASDHWR